MASNINPNNIDGTYPIAGQDNDSQGFRTNFTNIKNNFIYSKAEIEDLQAKVVVKAALTGTSVDNNMAGTLFRSAEVRDLRETRVALSSAGGTVILDHAAGSYYTVTTSDDISLAFSGFPASGKLGRIRLEVYITDTSHKIILPENVDYGLDGIAGFDGEDTISFSDTGYFVFEFTTVTGGSSVHIADFSRARTYFQSSTITLQQRTPAPTGAEGDIAGMIAIDTSYIYICTGSYDGSYSIWKRLPGAMVTYS